MPTRPIESIEGDHTPPYTGPVLNRTMAGDAGSGSRYIYQKHRLEVLEAAVTSLPQINDDTTSIVANGITLDLSKGFGKRQERYADHARDVLVIVFAATKALSRLGADVGECAARIQVPANRRE